ncbi:putative membrane protein [Anaerobacterium chartisolvens]|uniref:Putative membrane protein n=1 Tax=Anaerobacterium chartisolvens TaxID=1297424 RepID=A0A369BBH7_9FIRM|nr:TIGR03943 family protein [Anaerobacterium chartisolvens]RCX18883.1 putative membrane protein [Anaerobacterium chartisolvens]
MYNVRYRRFNVEALIKAAIMLGFALFFYITIRSGTVQLYVHPRIVPYMKFSIAAMLLIAVFLVRSAFMPQVARVKTAYLLFFIIPLAASFLIPPSVMDTSGLSGNNFKPSQQPKAAPASDGSLSSDFTSPDDVGSLINEYPGTSEELYEIPEYQEDPIDIQPQLQGDKVIVDDASFAVWNDELYYNVDKYAGKGIEIKGQVLKDSQLKPDEFVVVRLMMSCCTADLQPIGIICRYDDAGKLASNTWIKINGKIVRDSYEGELYPLIEVESVENASKPEEEYLYP